MLYNSMSVPTFFSSVTRYMHMCNGVSGVSDDSFFIRNLKFVTVCSLVGRYFHNVLGVP